METAVVSIQQLLTRDPLKVAEWLGLKPPDLPESIARQAPKLFQLVGSIPPIRTFASRLGINYFAYATSPRPRAFSMASDYTSWRSLTDRTFTGRHLPAATASPDDLPGEAEVVKLYQRSEEIKSSDTSVWFTFFAQWFTDSFLRTDPNDYRKNTSTQEIDLCQIYGLSAEKTAMLRSHEAGRLKSQVINDQEYPPFLFEPREPGGEHVIKPEFKGLHDERFLIDRVLGDCPDDRMDSVFAVGLEHGSSTIGHAILDTVFLREHNRVAGLLKIDNPDWDDDRLFETTRNIMITMLLKLIVEDYIRHIGPFDFPIAVVPFIADRELWNRPNWIAIEFNLLYRWHSLVPDVIGDGPDRLQYSDFRCNNPLVIAQGIEPIITKMSRERAGKIGLLNTPNFLTKVEERTVTLMRKARLRSYNDYREEFGLKRLTSFEQLTANADLRDRLQTLYGDIDSLEWYVGMFGEDYPEYAVMGELMTTMVAYDAFTQALTNPLLARNVFTEQTFSKTGMKVINETSTLRQIVVRNASSSADLCVSFQCE
jgi:prostaglandin-endoperoxide synthase 2